MSLQADSLRDIKLNEKREITIGADGDLALTDGVNTVEQSVAIQAANVLRPLVGEQPVSGQLQNIEENLARVLRNDVQVEDVQRVEVTEVNRSTGEVTIEVFVGFNNSFTIQPTVQ